MKLFLEDYSRDQPEVNSGLIKKAEDDDNKHTELAPFHTIIPQHLISWYQIIHLIYISLFIL